MKTQEELKFHLQQLINEHSMLDQYIKNTYVSETLNQLAIQRLKKKKLTLKDQIEKIRSQLLPDIIA